MNLFIKALLICVVLLAAIGWFSRNNASQSAAISKAELAL